MKEKVLLFRSDNKGKDFDGFIRFDYPESENHNFSGWCVRLCVCVYVSSIKLKNKLYQKLQIWYSTFVSY